MTSMKTPWPGLEVELERLGKYWVAARLATALLTDLIAELEKDPSEANWGAAIPIQQYLLRVGLEFDLTAADLLRVDDTLVASLSELIEGMRLTISGETECCASRMRVLTDQAHELPWPFPFQPWTSA